MRALFDKELRPFLVPALVGALLFTGAYVVAFDVEGTLFAPPSDALPVVVFAALCCGALLGYGQLAVERHGDTLSYLLHRDQPPGRVLVAKCLAGWVLLAIVVHLPLLLFALWERWAPPLGHVLRRSQVAELALAAVACVPAHALGLLCATLRCAPGGRTALLLLLVTGLGLALSLFLGYPFASTGMERGVYAASLLLLGMALLRCVERELALVEDAERAPPVGRLAPLGLLSLVLIGVPAVLGLALLQGLAVQMFSGGTELLWRADVGLLRATPERGELKTAMGANDEPVDLVELIRPEMRTWVNDLDLICAGFATVWSSEEGAGRWVGDQPGVCAVVEGDRASYTVRAVDRDTGETILEQRCGPLAGAEGLLVPLLLVGSNLLHPPALVLGAHLAPPEQRWDEHDLLAGVLTGRRRRPLLVVAGFAVSYALAWLGDRWLARRGAERWRRRSWFLAIVLLGPIAWLAYLALEPRASRASPPRAALRSPLLASVKGALG